MTGFVNVKFVAFGFWFGLRKKPKIGTQFVKLTVMQYIIIA
jgi:hypothetical protein